MKILTIATVVLFLLACNDNETQKSNSEIENLSLNKKGTDSVLTLTYAHNIKHPELINATDKSIDILFNGVEGFLGGQENAKVRFSTECMVCEPLQTYGNGFIFAKRLYFDKEQIRYYSRDVNIPDTLDLIKATTYYGERKKKNFAFFNGSGTMNYQGQSCNDADYVSVQLKYSKGSIKVNKLINASFFEFDLDKDGDSEQYLLGTRNCSQEIVVLRIR